MNAAHLVNQLLETDFDPKESTGDPKEFAYETEPIRSGMMTIYSSHGELVISIGTGTVVDVRLAGATGWVNLEDADADEDGKFVLSIDRFDVNEYEKWLKDTFNATLEDGAYEDILIVGFWLKDGTYEPANADARREAASRGFGSAL